MSETFPVLQDYMSWPDLKLYMEVRVLPHFSQGTPAYYPQHLTSYINKLQDWETGAKQLSWLKCMERYGLESILYLADLYTGGDEDLMTSMVLSNAYTGRELRTMLIQSIEEWFDDVD